MSVGIANNNTYDKEMDSALASSWETDKNYNGNSNKFNGQNPMTNTVDNQSPSSFLFQDQHSLPNLIKDELLEMSYVARDLSSKLNTNSKKSSNKPNDNVLLKQVSEIMVIKKNVTTKLYI